MSKRTSLITALSALLLIGAGCGGQGAVSLELPTAPPPTVESPAAPPPGSPSGSPEQAEPAAAAPQPSGAGTGVAAAIKAEGPPYYVAFTAEQYAKAKAEGRPVLLYFWASWCPICRAEEPKIKEIVETMDVPVAGFRVNYDTQADLKAAFKIPYQHTTVILNAAGAEVERFTGPTAEGTLRAALRAAAR
jgi:thiol-disulfide isomerase/thioredoxin